MKRIHVWVSGRVQGVGYRMFVQNIAERLMIAGWVRNLPDGRVEAVAEGEDLLISRFLEEIEGRDEIIIRVDDIVKTEEAVEYLRGFEIRR